MRRLLALLFLALPALGQVNVTTAPCKITDGSCAPMPNATTLGCAASSVAVFLGTPVAMSCDGGLTYDATTDVLTAGALSTRNVTATALATPGSITVTNVLSRVASITTVAGASLVDGDYFTIKYDTGLTIPVEFDLSPGDGTTGGRIPLLFTAGDSADTIRDNIILLLNSAAPTKITASSGGAATVSIVLKTPGAAGDTNTENVANAGFAISGFVDPTHATTQTYKLVARLPDGTTTAAGAASTTATGTATLSAANFNRLTWSAVAGASGYDVYRTVGGATQGKIVSATTALTVDDTGLAGGGETAPTSNGTGVVTAQTLQAQGATGTDVAGANLTIRPGAGTGAATPPSLLFQIPAAIGSSSTAQTQFTRLTISSTSISSALPFTADTSDTRDLGAAMNQWKIAYLSRATLGSKSKAITDGSATAFATFTIADGATYTGEVIYKVKAIQGTSLQALAGRARFAATREGSTYTVVVNEVGTQLLAAAAGTLTGAIEIGGTGGVVTLSANFNTSLTPSTFTIDARFDSPDAALVLTFP